MTSEWPKKRFSASGFTCILSFFFLAFLFVLPGSPSAAPVELSSGRGPVSLNGRMDLLRDPSGKLTIDDVTKAEYADSFLPVSGRFSSGFTKDAVWLRFTLQRSDTSVDDEWWLEVFPPFLDDVTLYEPFFADPDTVSPAPLFCEKRSGRLLPVSSREISDRNFIFVLKLADTRPRTFYMRLKTDGSMFIDARLWDSHSYALSSGRTSLLLGGFYGIAGLLIILNLIFWVILRDRLFIIYSVFLVSLTSALLHGNGLASLYLFPEAPKLVYLLNGVSIPFVLITGSLLLEELIPLERTGFWRRSFVAVRGFSVFALVMVIAGQFRLVADPMQLVGLYLSTACVIVSIIGIYRRIPSAKLYGLTFIVYYLGGIMITVRNTNLLGLSRPFMDDAFQIGTAIHMVLIQIAIAHRFYRMEQERKESRCRMESDMIRTQKLESLESLAGGIAHDFNNMLTVIMSTTTLAKMYGEDNPSVVSKLEEAEKEIMHARELTNQLLTFAKGGAPVKRLSTFPDLLRDTVEFSLAGSNVDCIMNISGDLWAAEIDRIQISQVISNLVINAKQSMPEGGTITLTAKNVRLEDNADMSLGSGRYVMISVEDRGKGIPSEDMPRIFDPFFTTKSLGSGLGLSTSHSIISRHGGHIDVRSRPNEGSTFTVYLPASDEIFFEQPEDYIPGAGSGERLLIMDDDEDLLRNVAEMLTALGYETETAHNGEEALILIKRSVALSRPFDAVLLDMTVIGGMGGGDCLQEILRMRPDVKAVAMSGYAGDGVFAEYEKYGFSEVLRKPFSVEELQSVLNSVLGRGGRKNA